MLDVMLVEIEESSQSNIHKNMVFLLLSAAFGAPRGHTLA